MTLFQFALAIAPIAFAIGAAKTAFAGDTGRISGPFAHDNLAVYFIHGPSVDGKVPLTLKEAFDKEAVRLDETGAVSELTIENLGDEEIFIQSGDIVKGGRQDRVLTTTLVLPPKSGKVPVAAFCVERGRWSARGAESMAFFAHSAESMPSRAAKLAMKAMRLAPAAGLTAGLRGEPTETASVSRQGEVWRSVAETQEKLSENLKASVNAVASETSLQLSLENEDLQKARAAYTSALEPKGAEEADVVGYVFAVNGKVNGADIYPSNGLFRKMWSKMLAAGVTEAIGEKGAASAEAPATDKIAEFLAAAEKGDRHENDVAKLMRIDTRDAAEAVYVESKDRADRWVHRSYVAR